MDAHPLLSLAMVLTAGLIGGELAVKTRLPRVTGWIMTGILLGALAIPGLELETLKSFHPLTDFVLGYIAFSVGSRLNFRELRNAGKRLFLLLLAEATITPLVVTVAMGWAGGFPIEVAFVFAAVAVAGAPGTTLLVVREARARGVFVKTLVAAVALIDMIAVGIFVTIDSELSTGAIIDGPGFIITALPSALGGLGLAVALGIGVAIFVVLLTRAIVGHQLLGASLITSILIAWGLADYLEVSSILSCTFVGMTLANVITQKERAGEAYLRNYGDILFTAFYTLAGLKLDFGAVLPVAGMVALFFAARALGKSLSSFVAMTLAGSVKSVRRYLGIALLPHGGVAVGLLLMTQDIGALDPYADSILTVGLAALAINQLVGPSATRLALHAAGEAGHDRPRLLDFLLEQHILTSFKAKNKEDAIRRLVDLLYQTHAPSMEKSAFLQSVLDRDADESTCLGEGLMIPHGLIKGGEQQIVGVMAISEAGLDFETPDGQPIHAMVLLATSEADRMRHLEVLAAFARAIGGDRSVRDQLYSSRSPAHAYHILHMNDEAADFNYFLHDTLDDDSEEAPAPRRRIIASK